MRGAPSAKAAENTSNTKRFSVIVPFGEAIDDPASLFARRWRSRSLVLDGFYQKPPRDAPTYPNITSAPVRCGPAGDCNQDAELTEHEIPAFTDDSCTPDPDWLNHFSGPWSMASMLSPDTG
jgi:hypothetical protein